MPQAPLLSVEDVATFLDLNVKTVRKLIAQGKLQAHRVSATNFKVSPAAVTAFLDATSTAK